LEASFFWFFRGGVSQTNDFWILFCQNVYHAWTNVFDNIPAQEMLFRVLGRGEMDVPVVLKRGNRRFLSKQRRVQVSVLLKLHKIIQLIHVTLFPDISIRFNLFPTRSDLPGRMKISSSGKSLVDLIFMNSFQNHNERRLINVFSKFH
jgi:hypothetical protein